ncbi:MAG: PIN domain-containing protein [Sandaracinaceae bacterium]
MKLPIVALVDTSVFAELIGVPGMSSDRDELLDELRERLARGDELMLPLATIIETGNHIANGGNGDARRRVAIGFVDQVSKALAGKSPFTPTGPMTSDWMASWLGSFPPFAQQGVGLADLSIIQEWERQKRILASTRRILIWSKDHHLMGYDTG